MSVSPASSFTSETVGVAISTVAAEAEPCAGVLEDDATDDTASEDTTFDVGPALLAAVLASGMEGADRLVT